jgi:hypothetical protein
MAPDLAFPVLCAVPEFATNRKAITMSEPTQETYAEVAKACGIPRVRVLHGHTSQDTAYLQPDYPYGRERCQRKVWLARAVKGAARGKFRFEWQTSGKLAGQWNRPQHGQYSDFAVLVNIPDNREHWIETRGFGFWGPGPAEDMRLRVSGVVDGLDDDELHRYGLHLALSHKAGSSSWQRWDEVIVPRMLAYRAEHGKFPPADDDMALGTRLSEYDHPAACAAALLAEL